MADYRSQSGDHSGHRHLDLAAAKSEHQYRYICNLGGDALDQRIG